MAIGRLSPRETTLAIRCSCRRAPRVWSRAGTAGSDSLCRLSECCDDVEAVIRVMAQGNRPVKMGFRAAHIRLECAANAARPLCQTARVRRGDVKHRQARSAVKSTSWCGYASSRERRERVGKDDVWLTEPRTAPSDRPGLTVAARAIAPGASRLDESGLCCALSLDSCCCPRSSGRSRVRSTGWR
jgi:hypothetical protein